MAPLPGRHNNFSESWQGHLTLYQEMTCIMCELPGRYIVDRYTPYKYHWAARVPCCGKFVHRSCIKYFLI